MSLMLNSTEILMLPMFDFLPIKLRMHLGDMCAHISVGKNPAERKTILDQPGCARLLQVYNRGAKIS